MATLEDVTRSANAAVDHRNADMDMAVVLQNACIDTATKSGLGNIVHLMESVPKIVEVCHTC